jgi:hypothetical protein
MSTILSLLAVLGGATTVSAIGTRMSLYFYRQDVLEVHPHMAQQGQVSSSEAQMTLESSGTLYMTDSISASSRYAWIGLGVIAFIVLLAILVIADLLSGMAL